MTQYLHAALTWVSVVKDKAAALIPRYSRTVTDSSRSAASSLLSGLAEGGKRARAARGAWLFLTELAGVVLVAFGISLWSVPAALIIGGLVLVTVVEVRPPASQGLPELPPPLTLLRQQAENAAMVINSERYGLGSVDQEYLARLSRAEMERVIVAARAIGARKQ